MKRFLSLILALVIALSIPASLASCGDKEEEMGTGSCEYTSTRDTTGRKIHYVEMAVDGYGKMVILLDETTAPVTVNNFLKLVGEGFYDGLTFHRVIEDFMIQGGDPKGDGTGNSSEKIYGEFLANGFFNDIEHIKGVISMARGQDNDSASCQFFICNADARQSLDGSYAAFGYVVEGISVIDDITEDVYPKTKYASYRGDYSSDSKYGYKHYRWQYEGNGAIEDKEDQPVIEYIRVLDAYGA